MKAYIYNTSNVKVAVDFAGQVKETMSGKAV